MQGSAGDREGTHSSPFHPCSLCHGCPGTAAVPSLTSFLFCWFLGSFLSEAFLGLCRRDGL